MLHWNLTNELQNPSKSSLTSAFRDWTNNPPNNQLGMVSIITQTVSRVSPIVFFKAIRVANDGNSFRPTALRRNRHKLREVPLSPLRGPEEHHIRDVIYTKNAHAQVNSSECAKTSASECRGGLYMPTARGIIHITPNSSACVNKIWRFRKRTLTRYDFWISHIQVSAGIFILQYLGYLDLIKI
jgi:hypothetical protein